MTAVLGDPTTVEPTSTCDQCGLTDDHPKVHYGWAAPIRLWHHDCAPVKVQAEIIAGNINDQHPQHKVVLASIFQAARESKRGEELRAFVKQLHADIQPDSGAQMIWSNGIGNAILDATLNGGASGTVTLGAQTLTLPYKLKWTSTVATASTPGTEWTGGSYPAGGVSMSGAWGTGAASEAKASTAAISVSNSPALTWADNEIYDSTGTPVFMAAKGTPSLAISVSSGSTATVPSGSLTGATT